MPKVTSLDQLMITCLQDLRRGEEETLQRFPAIADAVTDPATLDALRRRLNDARDRAERLDAIGRTLGVDAMGEENVWMAGMLDDAEGDMQTEAAGSLLDLALIGAVRKMVTASLVSYETAVAVADRLEQNEAAAAFRRARDQEAEADAALRSALFAVASGT